MQVPVPRSLRGWLVPAAVGVVLIVGAVVLTDPADEPSPARGGSRATPGPATAPYDAALGAATTDLHAESASLGPDRPGATTRATRRAAGAGVTGDAGEGAVGDGGQPPAGPSGDPDDPGGVDDPATNPLDQSGPSITGLRAGDEVPDAHDQIFDDACGPTSIGVAATVLDGAGIRSVHLGWHFEARPGADGRRRVESGKTEMYRSAGRWGAQLGPFERGLAPTASVVITWWVDAVDGFGNVSRVYAPDSPDDERVTLSPCG
jgi:hypothetical protein